MDWLKLLMQNNGAVFMLIVVGIPVVMAFLSEMLKVVLRHRERMAMIQHGIHPDCPIESQPAQDGAAAEAASGRGAEAPLAGGEPRADAGVQ